MIVRDVEFKDMSLADYYERHPLEKPIHLGKVNPPPKQPRIFTGHELYLWGTVSTTKK